MECVIIVMQGHGMWITFQYPMSTQFDNIDLFEVVVMWFGKFLSPIPNFFFSFFLFKSCCKSSQNEGVFLIFIHVFQGARVRLFVVLVFINCFGFFFSAFWEVLEVFLFQKNIYITMGGCIWRIFFLVLYRDFQPKMRLLWICWELFFFAPTFW